MTLIDTAPIYGFGRSEEIVGRAIRGRRDSVVLATEVRHGLGPASRATSSSTATMRASRSALRRRKVYKCLRPDSIRNEIEPSLRRLGTDHIDLYQTHWQDSTTPIADTMAALASSATRARSAPSASATPT